MNQTDDPNGSLDQAIELLQGEVDRLQASLETYRHLDHPRRPEIIRWYVNLLDRRQDALDKLHAMLLAQRGRGQSIH